MIVESNPHGFLTIQELSSKYGISEITLGRILDKSRTYNDMYDKELHRYFNEKEAYEAINKYRKRRGVKFPLFGGNTNTPE